MILRSVGPYVCFLLCAASLAVGGELRKSPWTTWSPRPEILPIATREDSGKPEDRKGGEPSETLILKGGGNPAVFGGWHQRINGIEPGQWYRFSAQYTVTGITAHNRQVLARIEWLDAEGRRAGQPEFAYHQQTAGSGSAKLHGPVSDSSETQSRAADRSIPPSPTSSALRSASLTVPAPPRASTAVLQLYLAHAPDAEIRWSQIQFNPISTPPDRKITVAAVNLRPAKSSGPEANLEAFARTAEREIQTPVDLIVLPEGITVVGTNKVYAEVAEPADGPSVRRLGALARAKNSWVVAGIYERDGTAIYNTAILLDRQGKLAGKYRKVYLPREEVERGLTPGSDYPVFQTDFGPLGIMICYDVFYADPARALALAGAQVIAMPIWGGNQTLAAARSIENRVFLVSSGYDYPTRVQDPDGAIIASTNVQGSVALATIDLNRRYLEPHLGDMHQRLFNEVRLDVPVR
jgi:predicted amidohydrolase